MLRSLKSFVFCLAISCLLFSLSSAIAAPVTYRFQATVGELPPFNGDVGLPFTLVEGSVIDGLFTIDPSLSAPPLGNTSKTLQPFPIKFSFEGYSFGTEQYQATATNDSGITDGPNAGPADFLEWSCSSSSVDVGCTPEPLQLPGAPPLRFSLSADFAGHVSLLSAPVLPSDIDVWNGFTIQRDLVMRFIHSPGNSASYFTAISAFSVVPEPSCYLIIVVLINQLSCCRLFKNIF